MDILKFKISAALLECSVCHKIPKFLCHAGHVFCGETACVRAHTDSCCASSWYCLASENIVNRSEVKCACGGYFRNCNLKVHRLQCSSAKTSSGFLAKTRRKCRVKMELLRCSSCSVGVRPPVFMSRSGGGLICSDCYRSGEKHASCPDLDYFLGEMIVVRLPYPFCRLQKMAPASSPRKLCDKYGSNIPPADIIGSNIPPAGNNIITGSNIPPAGNNIITGNNIPPAGKNIITGGNIPPAGKNIITGSNIPPAGNNTIIGKTKGKAPSKGNVHESSEEESSNEIHPETGKNVAEPAVTTSACNKKAKIPMPSWQKTGREARILESKVGRK